MKLRTALTAAVALTTLAIPSPAYAATIGPGPVLIPDSGYVYSAAWYSNDACREWVDAISWINLYRYGVFKAHVAQHIRSAALCNGAMDLAQSNKWQPLPGDCLVPRVKVTKRFQPDAILAGPVSGGRYCW